MAIFAMFVERLMSQLAGLVALTALIGYVIILEVKAFQQQRQAQAPSGKVPISVNYHLTRQCNYKCGFCFHTALTSYVAPLADAKKTMSVLKAAGMKKVNFAGGEPFMNAKMLGQLTQFCKGDLKLESVSIVTNGSKVTEKWLQEYGSYLDIMAVSCDSFVEKTDVKIGRGTGNHLETVKKVSVLCKNYGVMLKINTVVNKFNFQEDMNNGIQQIDPFRWKAFQVLVVPEENGSEETLRDARRFVISNEEWQIFVQKHKHQQCFLPEGNDVMASSYLLLDEYLRFLNKGVSQPTKSILDIGVAKALEEVYWDTDGFEKRGGIYDWSKTESSCGSGKDSSALGW